MTHTEIRKKFLDFFEKNGHKIVPSSSLIPTDPSVLFTTAGMQQFKKYYLNEASPYGNRVVSIQKCIRTTDIDEVGDESHLTFFEMLGNFSFKFPEAEDAYFKEEAIKLAYDFIVGELNISLDRIKVSIFKGDPENKVSEDRESLEIWKKLGIPERKISFGSKEDNFWGPTGDEGPCGPTTEIYVDDIEVWNIVFNEYYCDSDSATPTYVGGGTFDESKKHMVPLERKGVDTGMGLERLVLVLQGEKSVFETDLFIPLIAEIRGKDLYDYEANRRSERIIADHLKASIFIISDGISPSNVGQGYILRRLLRKVLRHLKKLNLPTAIPQPRRTSGAEPSTRDFLQRFVKTTINLYKEYYPELEKNSPKILEVINEEFEKFGRALDKGLSEFEKLKLSVLKNNQKTISGAEAFNLYQNFGFPLEFMKEMAQENGLEVDSDGFYKNLEKHKEVSKALNNENH